MIARSDPMLVQNAFWEGIGIALKDLSNEVSARLYRSAKSSSDAPVNSSSFSNRQYLRLVRGQFDSMAAALSRAYARSVNLIHVY